MRSLILCSCIIIISLLSSANAESTFPYRSIPGNLFYARYPDYSLKRTDNTLESLQNDLKISRNDLQNQLQQVNQRLDYIQQLLAAQQALKLNWVNAKTNQSVPGALNVAFDGKNTEICRAKFMTGTHPGLVTSSGCLITYAGYALSIPNYDVLVGKTNMQWRTVDPKIFKNYQSLDGTGDANVWKQPSVPILGGYENNLPLYICKGSYNNSVKVGKLLNDICNVADGPDEITIREFQVLFGG